MNSKIGGVLAVIAIPVLIFTVLMIALAPGKPDQPTPVQPISSLPEMTVARTCENTPSMPSCTPEGRAALANAVKERQQAEATKGLNDLRAAQFLPTVRDMQRDPDSFVLVSQSTGRNGYLCMEYRSHNGFSGVNQGSALLTPKNKVLIYDDSMQTGAPGFVGLWNKNCASK